MNTLILLNSTDAFFWLVTIILCWVLFGWIVWNIKIHICKTIEVQGRIFMYYWIISAFLLVWIFGDKVFDPDFRLNFLTELLGIGITVTLVDRIYAFITKKNELFFRNLLIRTCRMPIHAYFHMWYLIFREQSNNYAVVMGRFQSLEAFFISDEFYEAVTTFNFNNIFSDDKTYAKYINEKMVENGDRFQNILAKYASKLSVNDVRLLEHFGSGSYMFAVFNVMDFISELRAEHYVDGVPVDGARLIFNNSIGDIRRENLNRHFQKFLELVNEYNIAVNNEQQNLTLLTLTRLYTIEAANDNPAIEW